MSITDKNKSVLNRLKDLQSLYEAGVLTKEEMETEKAEILGSNKKNVENSQVSLNQNETYDGKRRYNGNTVTKHSKKEYTGNIYKFFHSYKSIIVIIVLIVIVVIISVACVKSCGDDHVNNDFAENTMLANTDTVNYDDTVSVCVSPAEDVPTKFKYIAKKKGNFRAIIEWPVSMTGLEEIGNLQRSIMDKFFRYNYNNINACINRYLKEGEESDGYANGFMSVKFIQRQNDIYIFNERFFGNYGGAGASVICGENYLNFDRELGRDLKIDDLTNDYMALLNLVNSHISLDEYSSKAEKLPENFVISSKGITFIFPAYSIGYGYQGQPNIFLSYDELDSVLSETFKRAIGNIPFEEKWEKCKLLGNMTDENGSYPIEIYFERRGHDLRKCVYRNVNYGGKIKMKGELLDDKWYFTGNDNGNYFEIAVDVYNMKGTANVGQKEFEVSFK